MFLAEREVLVGQQREIRRDYELKLALFRSVARFGHVHYLLDALKVQQRLAALKLDLDEAGRRTEYELHSLARRLLSHVESGLVVALPGDLAIVARVLATECDDEYV